MTLAMTLVIDLACLWGVHLMAGVHPGEDFADLTSRSSRVGLEETRADNGLCLMLAL